MRNYPYEFLKDNKNIKGIVYTDAIAGCASIMRSSRLRKVGLSDPEFSIVQRIWNFREEYLANQGV